MAYNNKAGVIVPFAQKFYKQMIVVIAGLFIASMAAMTLSASAATTTVNFEPATYAVRDINGQDGWSKTGNYDVEVVNNVGAPDSFGKQSLRISNAITSGSFGDHTFSKSLQGESGETAAVSDGLSIGPRSSYFEAEWDFASMIPGAQQSGLSVVASPDRGDGARMSWVQMADTASGIEINFFDYQKGRGFVQTNVVSGMDRTVPHTIKITMEFIDGEYNDVVKVYVDGALKHTGTSWEGYFKVVEAKPTRTVDSILFRTSGTAYLANSGKGFLIDNFNSSNVAKDTTAPIAPVVLRMEDSAANTIPNNGTTGSYSVTTLWSTVSDASFYEYSYWNDIVGSPYKEAEASRYIATPVNGTSLSGVFNQGEGVHHVAVRAVDAAGNRSAWSNTYTVTYDATPPVVLGSKEACIKDGWKLSELPVFKNQGQCVSSFVKNPKSVR